MTISEQGVNLADIGGWLGHPNIQTTRSIYAPIINSRMRRIADSLTVGCQGGMLPVTIRGVPDAVPRAEANLTGIDDSLGKADSSFPVELGTEIGKSRDLPQ